MFDLAQFIIDCRIALTSPSPQRAIREVVQQAVSDPAALTEALGPASLGGIQRLHQSPDLTVLDVHWRPRMVLTAHNHNMWAVIGVYCGREDNILWRRAGDERIEAAGALTLAQGETIAFGPEVIHSVVNPLSRLTRAIHVYGGDFFAVERSEWDPEDLSERPYDMSRVLNLFGSRA